MTHLLNYSYLLCKAHIPNQGHKEMWSNTIIGLAISHLITFGFWDRRARVDASTGPPISKLATEMLAERSHDG